MSRRRTLHERFLDVTNSRESGSFVKGPYQYFHYKCDGVDDRGWGCGYRTLQSIASWVIGQKGLGTEVPSIRDLQKVIAEQDDTKPSTFVGCKEWIGCYETFLALDALFGVPCKIIHCTSADCLKDHGSFLAKHFHNGGGPVAVGGDEDASSKAIFGIKQTENGFCLLVVDPHFVSEPCDNDNSGPCDNDKDIFRQGFVRWMFSSQFSQSSFYNFCVPL